MTINLATNVGKVRLLITDTDEVSRIFTDVEISTFLGMEGESVRRGAALALETISTQQALLLKVIKNLDLETDGAKLAAVLMKRASVLREQDSMEDPSALFDWAEVGITDFQRREILLNDAMRRY